MTIDGQHQRAFRSLVREPGEWTLQIKQKTVVMKLPCQNFMTVFVAKIQIVIEVAGHEDDLAARITHFDRQPYLSLGHEAGRKVVTGKAALHIDSNLDP